MEEKRNNNADGLDLINLARWLVRRGKTRLGFRIVIVLNAVIIFIFTMRLFFLESTGVAAQDKQENLILVLELPDRSKNARVSKFYMEADDSGDGVDVREREQRLKEFVLQVYHPTDKSDLHEDQGSAVSFARRGSAGAGIEYLREGHISFTMSDPSTYHGPVVEGWPPTRNRYDVLSALRGRVRPSIDFPRYLPDYVKPTLDNFILKPRRAHKNAPKLLMVVHSAPKFFQSRYDSHSRKNKIDAHA